MQMTGAEIVIRCLQEEGVEYVFGYPGGAVLNIYDELFKQDKVKHVLVRHEQGAVHAADGYSRITFKPGVAVVTAGPGVTDVVMEVAVGPGPACPGYPTATCVTAPGAVRRRARREWPGSG